MLRKELHAPERHISEYVRDKAASNNDAAFWCSEGILDLAIEVVFWCVRTGIVQDLAQLADPNRA